jgi:hypothetical protein
MLIKTLLFYSYRGGPLFDFVVLYIFIRVTNDTLAFRAFLSTVYSHDTGPLTVKREREELCESTECVCHPSVRGWPTTVGWLAGF